LSRLPSVSLPSLWNSAPAKADEPKIVVVLLLIRTLSNFRSSVICCVMDAIEQLENSE